MMSKEYLQRTAEILTRNGRITTDIGLFHGSAGISLFLFHCSRFLENDAYYNVAYEMVDQIHEFISNPVKPLPVTQLPEIGCLFLHLERADLLEIGEDPILEKIDQILCDNSVYNHHKQSEDSFLLHKTAYLITRHRHAHPQGKKIKLEEALIHLVDDIQALYHSSLKPGMADAAGRDGFLTCLAMNRHVRNTCVCALLLLEVQDIQISKQAILHILADICNDLTKFVFTNDKFLERANNHVPEYHTLVYAVFVTKLLEKSIKDHHFVISLQLLRGLNKAAYRNGLTCHLADTLITICFLKSLTGKYNDPDFDEEIRVLLGQVNTFLGSDRPGHLGSPVGIVNLGLRNGIAGAGIAVLSELSGKPLLDNDMLMMNLTF